MFSFFASVLTRREPAGSIEEVLALPIALVVTGSLLVAASTSPPTAAGEWLLVESPHFEVMSDASENDARRAAEELELIRAVFSLAVPGLPAREGPRIPVLAARDEASLKRLLPHLEESGRSEIPGGLFWRTSHRNFIVLRTDLKGDNPFEVVYHEYFHSLMNPALPRAPLWFQEGLASVWENTTVTSDRVETARPNRLYLSMLREEELLPLSELLAASVGDPATAPEAHRSAMFYAQSWALVHYIMFGAERDALRPRMNVFLAAVEDGASPVAAFESQIGSVEAMDEALRRYVRRSELTALRMDRPETPDPSEFLARALPPAEARARLAQYYALTRRRVEAESHVAEALALAPASALAQETAGYLRYLDGDKSEAVERFEAARRLDGSRALTFYFLAQMRAETLAGLDDLAYVRESFERAASLDPLHAPSLARLSLLYRGEPGKRETALALADRASALAPDDAVARTAFGIALKQAGRIEEAVAELESALRLDPASALAREELEEARQASAFPMFGVWQYESYQLWLRVDAEGRALRCRVDTDGTLHWDEGRIDASELSWSDGAVESVSLEHGRLVLGGVRYDRSFPSDGPCGVM